MAQAEKAPNVMFEINQWLLLLSTSRKWFAQNADWRQDGGNQSMRKPNTLKIQRQNQPKLSHLSRWRTDQFPSLFPQDGQIRILDFQESDLALKIAILVLEPSF